MRSQPSLGDNEQSMGAGGEDVIFFSDIDTDSLF